MSFDLETLRRAVAAHARVARVLVAAQRGSAPRGAGTAMLVWQGGQAGTIGGGALEHEAIDLARRRLSAPGPGETLRRPLGPALGQCCGGDVTLAIEVFDAGGVAEIPTDGVYIRPTEVAGAGQRPLAVAAGGSQRPLAVERAARALRSGQPVPPLQEGWLVEPLGEARHPVWVWGAGHVGHALVTTLAGLPVEVVWVDDRAGAFPDRLPKATTKLHAANPVDAVPHAPDLATHYVLTYSHALDLALVDALLRRPHRALGLIGSATKKARFLSRLRAAGHDPARLDRLQCPIGDPRLGKHPQAIAVGVVHALLKELNGAAERQSQQDPSAWTHSSPSGV